MNGIEPPIAWAVAALLLGIAELVVPGVFLVFLAIAAAVVAAMTWALPDLPLVAQLAAFGVWSAVAVLVGRRWYADYPLDSDDALLNDRAGRMIGEHVTVDTAITAGHGRVRIGDGSWPARGPDTEAGRRVRIIGMDGAIVVVEADEG